MLGETQRQEGNVVVTVLKGGVEVRRVAAKNQIVSGGRTLVANLFRGHEKRGVTHLALGSGMRAVTSSDTGLEAELRPRRSFDTTEVSAEVAAQAVLPSDDGKPALRVTALNAGSSGNLMRIRAAREGKKLRLVVEGPEGREEIDDFRLEEAARVQSRYVRLEAQSKEPPAVSSTPAELSGGQDVTALLSATFGYDECNGRVAEAGLFTAADEGVMYNRVVFAEIQKTSSLSLTIAWRITF